MLPSQMANLDPQADMPITNVLTEENGEGERGEKLTREEQDTVLNSPQNRKSEVQVSSQILGPDKEKRCQSTSITIPPQLGIDWRSPITMILVFLLGLGSAFALHGYYSYLNGKEVGDSSQQQNALRIGTALAFITQISLVGSTQFAYVQCLWRALKRSVISVSAVNAGFDVINSMLCFTNLEMLLKLRVASSLALIAWCIPIATLVTPATLNVNAVARSEAKMVNVSTLQIAQAAEYFNFAYTVPYQSQVHQRLQEYLGPRTILTRLAVATATMGQILSLPAPFTNATYEQRFFGPYVQCHDANSTIADQIDMAARRAKMALDPSIQELSNEYFAFVPALVNLSGPSPGSGVQVANLTAVNGALNASNELWMKFPRYSPNVTILTVTNVAIPHYLRCDLHNASYQVNFSWVNGVQSISMPEPENVEAVPYPVNGTSLTMNDEIMAYSAFMWALSKQLTGSMAFYQPTSSSSNSTNGTFSGIDTSIDQTSLLGSSDFDSYFIKNHALNGNAGGLFSAQRLQDIAYARNRTLDVLIPELSSNITISLISNPLLSPSTMTRVTTTTPVNVYAYHSHNVLLAYTLALLFALLANVLGFFAYFSNGVSHDNSFSSIFCTTRDIHLSQLNAHERLGALPLDPKVGRTKLKYNVGGEAGGERYGFGAA